MFEYSGAAVHDTDPKPRAQRTQFLTVAEASVKSGLSASYIKRACREGKLRAFKPGHDWFIAEDDFDEWFKNRKPVGNPNFKPRP